MDRLSDKEFNQYFEVIDESLNNDKVSLEYFDLYVDDGEYSHTFGAFTYEADKEEVIGALCILTDKEEDEVEADFENLVDKYYNDLLDAFEDKAKDVALNNYIEDQADYDDHSYDDADAWHDTSWERESLNESSDDLEFTIHYPSLRIAVPNPDSEYGYQDRYMEINVPFDLELTGQEVKEAFYDLWKQIPELANLGDEEVDTFLEDDKNVDTLFRKYLNLLRDHLKRTAVIRAEDYAEHPHKFESLNEDSHTMKLYKDWINEPTFAEDKDDVIEDIKNNKCLSDGEKLELLAMISKKNEGLNEKLSNDDEFKLNDLLYDNIFSKFEKRNMPIGYDIKGNATDDETFIESIEYYLDKNNPSRSEIWIDTDKFTGAKAYFSNYGITDDMSVEQISEIFNNLSFEDFYNQIDLYNKGMFSLKTESLNEEREEDGFFYKWRRNLQDKYHISPLGSTGGTYYIHVAYGIDASGHVCAGYRDPTQEELDLCVKEAEALGQKAEIVDKDHIRIIEGLNEDKESNEGSVPWVLQQGEDGELEYLGFAKSQEDMIDKMVKDHRSDSIYENTYIDELDKDTYLAMRDEGVFDDEEEKELNAFFGIDEDIKNEEFKDYNPDDVPEDDTEDYEDHILRSHEEFDFDDTED